MRPSIVSPLETLTRFTKVLPVIPLSTGFIDIVGAAAGGTVGLIGVFWGCEYVSSTTGEKIFSNYWPGSGADSNHPVEAFVYDNPMQTFVIASDASLTSEATARGHVFANANFANSYIWFNSHRYLVC